MEERISQYIQIGDFVIVRHDENSLWIETEGGEGGQFPESDIEALIKQYYADNF